MISLGPFLAMQTQQWKTSGIQILDGDRDNQLYSHSVNCNSIDFSDFIILPPNLLVVFHQLYFLQFITSILLSLTNGPDPSLSLHHPTDGHINHNIWSKSTDLVFVFLDSISCISSFHISYFQIIFHNRRSSISYFQIWCFSYLQVGQQKTPCRFLTIPLLAPPPPDQCQAHNVTHSSFQVIPMILNHHSSI